ncbi:MAG: hypothetical protein CK429_02555 [Mycobacterium sp.]|nr:MAG: hypothetical protein CK429_02555 [Mycobacterium sp.]
MRTRDGIGKCVPHKGAGDAEIGLADSASTGRPGKGCLLESIEQGRPEGGGGLRRRQKPERRGQSTGDYLTAVRPLLSRDADSQPGQRNTRRPRRCLQRCQLASGPGQIRARAAAEYEYESESLSCNHADSRSGRAWNERA